MHITIGWFLHHYGRGVGRYWEGGIEGLGELNVRSACKKISTTPTFGQTTSILHD